MTQHIPIDNSDVRHYLSLHGVEVKSDGKNGLWLKLPIPCLALDPKTLRCTVHDNRPDICKVYPRNESPFIPKEKCSLL